MDNTMPGPAIAHNGIASACGEKAGAGAGRRCIEVGKNKSSQEGLSVRGYHVLLDKYLPKDSMRTHTAIKTGV